MAYSICLSICLRLTPLRGRIFGFISCMFLVLLLQLIFLLLLHIVIFHSTSGGLRILQLLQCLQECVTAVFVQNFAIANEFTSIVPLVVPGQNMQCK